MKYCKKCDKDKPLTEFTRNSRAKSGLTSYCKQCNQILDFNKRLKGCYKLSSLDYENLMYSQDNRCAICGEYWKPDKQSRRLSIDHNHETGKIRGLLCRNCNTGIGMLKDNIQTIQNALDYLKKHKQ